MYLSKPMSRLVRRLGTILRWVVDRLRTVTITSRAAISLTVSSARCRYESTRLMLTQQVVDTTGTRHHRYSKQQVLETADTRHHRYSTPHVLEKTGTRNNRYLTPQVLETT